MRMLSRRGRLLTGALAVGATLALAACGGTPADGSADPEATAGEDPAEYYQGKTITMIVPYNPGGGFDSFLRLLAPHLEDELDGVTIRVENQPGGGGLIGANLVYQAEPDGLTVGLINYPGAVFAEVTDTEGVAFDNAEWSFYGRLGALPPLVYTGPDSEYTTFEDILESDRPVKFGLGGVGSDAWYVAVAISKVFGFPNEIIGGYPGSAEADGALLVGEVDASVNSGGAGVLMVEGSGAHGVVAISNDPLPQLPDVPVISDFGDADQQEILTALASMYDLERLVVGPPGVPDERIQYLADAIFRAASQPGYAEEMEAASYPVNPLDRAGTVELAGRASAAVGTLAELLNE